MLSSLFSKIRSNTYSRRTFDGRTFGRNSFDNHTFDGRTFGRNSFHSDWLGKSSIRKPSLSNFRKASLSNIFEENRFGFGRGAFPPLPRRFTHPLFNKHKPDNVEVTRQGAIVDFSNKITLTVGFNPVNDDPAFTTEITGNSQIIFGRSKDAIKNDPLLGTVGKFDGKYDVSKSEIVSSRSTGQTPIGDNITVNIGDGTPDLKFITDEDTPPLSLASGGVFSLVSDDLLSSGTEVKSFYKIFLEIQDAPNGTLRNKAPIVVESEFSGNLLSQDQLNLTYSSSSVVPLYTAGADGVFWTGDEQVAAKLVPGANGSSLTVNLSADLG